MEFNFEDCKWILALILSMKNLSLIQQYFPFLPSFFVSHKFRHFQLFCDLKLLEELTLLNADGNATVASVV